MDALLKAKQCMRMGAVATFSVQPKGQKTKIMRWGDGYCCGGWQHAPYFKQEGYRDGSRSQGKGERGGSSHFLLWNIGDNDCLLLNKDTTLDNKSEVVYPKTTSGISLSLTNATLLYQGL